MKTYALPENVRKAIMDYFLTRPLGEVYEGFNALRSLQEIPQEPDAAPSKGDGETAGEVSNE